MQEKHLFEYAVIRIVPRVEREEFLNVGVILYCASQNFLKARYHLDEPRLLSFSPHINISELRSYLNALERICMGDSNGKLIGQLPIASRFRWLTAVRSTVVQTSRVHPGLCQDPEDTLLRLYKQLALQIPS